MATADELTTYPTRVMRLRKRLGFCSWCWKRSTARADIAAEDDAGNVLRSIPLRLCPAHVEEVTRAMTSVPYTATAHLNNGVDLPRSDRG